jgi:RHS repeat-associated protein
VHGLDLIAQVDGTTTSYYHADGLGSTRVMTDDAGVQTAAYTYDAFGNIRSQGGGTGNSFTYTGEQFDPEAALVFLRARYYDPQIGRFVSKDSFPGFARQTQTVNRYLYTLNNPITAVDPSGHFNIRQVGVGAFDMLSGAGTVATSLALGTVATGLCATGVGCLLGAPVGAYAANQAFVGGQKIGYGAVELGLGIRNSSTEAVESFDENIIDPLKIGMGVLGENTAPHLGITSEQGKGIGEGAKEVLDLVASFAVGKYMPGNVKSDTIAYYLWQQGAMATTGRGRLFTQLLLNKYTSIAGRIDDLFSILRLTSTTVYAPGPAGYLVSSGGFGGGGGGSWGEPPSQTK